ncbi:MAG: sulfite exporter TauE/SafE family protein [Chloroflexi bacterium]|nr:sulfite exporter TauE/SafE family protein [Chloroflexota bacterium]
MLLCLTTLLDEVNLWALGGTGLVAGLLGSMLGVGGGFLIVPILTLALHLPIKVAIGSSLVAIVANSCTAAGIYTKARLTNIKLGLLLETATIPGAIIGGFAAAVIAPSVLSAIFGLALIYAAYTMITRQHFMSVDTQPNDHLHLVEPSKISDNLSSSLTDSYYDQNLNEVVTYKVTRIPAGLGTSFFAGILSSLLGVGGGIVNVPVMHLVMGVPMKAAIATSTLIITITAAAGALIYHYQGHIYPFIIAPLAIGIVIGARIGVELTQRAKGLMLRRIFGAFLLLIAILMFLKTVNII